MLSGVFFKSTERVFKCFKLFSKSVSFMILLKLGSLSNEVSDTCHIIKVEGSQPGVVKKTTGYQRSVFALVSLGALVLLPSTQSSDI